MTLWYTVGAFFLGTVFGTLLMSLMKANAYDQGLHDGWRECARYIQQTGWKGNPK